MDNLSRVRVDVLDGAGGEPAVPQLDRVKVGGGQQVAVDPLPANLQVRLAVELSQLE